VRYRTEKEPVGPSRRGRHTERKGKRINQKEGHSASSAGAAIDEWRKSTQKPKMEKILNQIDLPSQRGKDTFVSRPVNSGRNVSPEEGLEEGGGGRNSKVVGRFW